MYVYVVSMYGVGWSVLCLRQSKMTLQIYRLKAAVAVEQSDTAMSTDQNYCMNQTALVIRCAFDFWMLWWMDSSLVWGSIPSTILAEIFCLFSILGKIFVCGLQLNRNLHNPHGL